MVVVSVAVKALQVVARLADLVIAEAAVDVTVLAEKEEWYKFTWSVHIGSPTRSTRH